jgi:hypothetical protein
MCSVPMKLWPTSSDSRRPPQGRLRAGRERDRPGRRVVALTDDRPNPVAHDVHVQARLAQHAGCDTWLLAHESQQQVLGAYGVVAECTRLVLCQHDHLARALGKALKHPPSIDSPHANAKPRHGQP